MGLVDGNYFGSIYGLPAEEVLPPLPTRKPAWAIFHPAVHLAAWHIITFLQVFDNYDISRQVRTRPAKSRHRPKLLGRRMVLNQASQRQKESVGQGRRNNARQQPDLL